MKVKGNKVYFEANDYQLAKELLRKFIVIHADGTGPSDIVDADPGPESGEDASFRDNENDVTLTMFSGMKHVDTADFDVRNTPRLVKWILDHIQ